jgi:tRNA1Val (adenine37-N6)-methyltransferase
MAEFNVVVRSVPLSASLSTDAPGYSSAASSSSSSSAASPELTAARGPTCWKCAGVGTSTNGRAKTTIVCKVCKGEKYLPVKQQPTEQPGRITTIRAPSGWTPSEPRAANNANSIPQDSPLFPRQGEELCGLISDWRIYQRVKGHRWTTDDICTSWMAGKAMRDRQAPEMYLDLGCGNGSVLLMTSWQFPNARCIGIEARKEGVENARRSIKFNCGDSERVVVRNEDFRTIYASDADTEDILPERGQFDLITGTPPYFLVDFQVSNNNEEEVVVVQSAVIRQGGMPTCSESAPARCEYRGGVEAYCFAASVALAPSGVFVVCENWLNHDRVLRSAVLASLRVVSVKRVIGRVGKPPLFGVYVMVLRNAGADKEDIDVSDLTVRDSAGKWTDEYAALLRDMAYPVAQ